MGYHVVNPHTFFWDTVYCKTVVTGCTQYKNDFFFHKSAFKCFPCRNVEINVFLREFTPKCINSSPPPPRLKNKSTRMSHVAQTGSEEHPSAAQIVLTGAVKCGSPGNSPCHLDGLGGWDF